MNKKKLPRQNPKCHQSYVRQQERLQSSEGASDYFCCDWLTCQQLSNHQQLLKKEKKKKRTISCGVLACLFYGLIFVGHNAEGTQQRGGFLTICQGRLSGDTCYWNRDIFICFKDSTGHLLCHWKWSLAVELTVFLIQIWQVVVWLAKGRSKYR